MITLCNIVMLFNITEIRLMIFGGVPEEMEFFAKRGELKGHASSCSVFLALTFLNYFNVQ